ncbi:response regulator transcription factor [Bacillus sp. FJAT-27445]|uniref:response regulator transcription factor n=1 Tax=Bacillus sp. FJAT-27445 TaxID=1679166 RepID=UPI0026483BDF|nr:response regulator transcription factor [Bacillus sp. FJAT-27445]
MIVEDDPKLRKLISLHLDKWDFSSYPVDSFDELDSEAKKLNPDLILLDINLPAYDGFYWCKKIREVSTAPIVFISSRTENMDIVMAMNVGGDDYIQKPFSLEVLVAKLNAILRRAKTPMLPVENVIEYNGLLLNLEKATVRYDGREAILTKNEFHILVMLMKRPGKITGRDEIMRALWEDESFIDDNTLTVNMNRLRKKLESLKLSSIIQTRKGQGYILQ